MNYRARRAGLDDGIVRAEVVQAADPPSFAHIDLAREVAVVLIFVLREAPPPRLPAEPLRELRVVLCKPEQPRRVIAQSLLEFFAPFPTSLGPGLILFRQVGRDQAVVMVVRIALA